MRGAALSGIAAEGLETGAGIRSRTVHSLLYGLEQGRDTLTARDVLVVDEAGMIGSRQMERLLSAAAGGWRQGGAGGGPGAAAGDRGGSGVPGDRRAGGRCGDHDGAPAAAGLAAAGDAGAGDGPDGCGAGTLRGGRHGVGACRTWTEARAALVAGWDAARREDPQARQIILASIGGTTCATSTPGPGQLRRAAGELGEDQVLATERGDAGLCRGRPGVCSCATSAGLA